MKIVADSHVPFIKEYFSTYGELVLKPGRSIAYKDVKDADILLVRSITHVDKKLLKKSRVKFVGSVTAGADHLDTKWLDEAGITWSVACGFNAPPVADYVVCMIAALQRKRLLMHDRVKVGVIGVGHVGRLVVERLKLLNCDIVLCDPIRAEREKGFFSTPLDEFSDLDLITLHVPLIRSGEYHTYHFINKNFLQKQKPNCILLNASRGAVVHSQTLMQYGSHLKWCLDVWEHEPKIDKTMLQRAFIATPHIAGYSVQSKIRGIDMIYRIACKKKIIKPQSIPPLDMPHQRLTFAGEKHHWQDIALGVFNPLLMTAMMRTTLLPANDHGHLFDEMRNQFTYRHEFAYTTIAGVVLPDEDKQILEKMGLEVEEGS